MALNAKKVPKAAGNNNRIEQPNIDPGSYPARVVQIIDLGLQPQRPYKGEEKDPAYSLMMTYELLDEFCVDENGEPDETKPRWISEEFPLRNLEADLAKSTKRYKALDPDEDHGGDFTALIEAPCMVNVINNKAADGRVFDNIAGVTGMRPKDAARAAPLVNEPKVFNLDEPDVEVFRSLPQWIQDKIKGNLDFGGSALEEALAEAPAPKEKAKPKAKAKPQVEEPEEDGQEIDEDDPW